SQTNDVQTGMDYTESDNEDVGSVNCPLIENGTTDDDRSTIPMPENGSDMDFQVASPRKATKIRKIATEEPIATANKYYEL
ncbi:hypothetical protein AVEN_102414-1, partial [Araneus ventricosus]